MNDGPTLHQVIMMVVSGVSICISAAALMLNVRTRRTLESVRETARFIRARQEAQLEALSEDRTLPMHRRLRELQTMRFGAPIRPALSRTEKNEVKT